MFLILSVFLLAVTVAVPAVRTITEPEAEVAPPTGAVLPTEEEPRVAVGPPGDFVDPDGRGPRLWSDVQRFYRARDFHRAWLRGGRLTREAEQLLRAAASSHEEGLDPRRYDPQTTPLVHLVRASAGGPSLSAEQLEELEVRLTYSFLRYASDVLEGRFDPRAPFWALRPGERDAVPPLLEAAEGAPEKFLRLVLPRHPHYEALKRALARYRGLADEGGWPRLTATTTLKAGRRNPAVPALRGRLALSGDLEPGPPPADAEVFDAALGRALRRFERRHGLEPDGVLDKAALAALNVPVERRVAQIELSLERWRWLPRELGERHILVNIPAFELRAYQDGRAALSMRVVTGRADESPTPVFSEEMTHVVFSPYWNVPPGIAETETIPAVSRDRGYLARNNLEVVRGSRVVDPWSVDPWDPAVTFRQRPGPGNSLGLVKFLFPNRYNVYLHDTPSRALFRRARRDFSHGCVRVEKPFELARWLLEGTKWSDDRIRGAMAAGVEDHVRLERPVPVYITYFTAWVDDDGTLHFGSDLYGHDGIHRRALAPVPDEARPALKVAAAAAPVSAF